MFIVESLKGERALCAISRSVCVLFSYYKGSNVIANAIYVYCIQMYTTHIYFQTQQYTKLLLFLTNEKAQHCAAEKSYIL